MSSQIYRIDVPDGHLAEGGVTAIFYDAGFPYPTKWTPKRRFLRRGYGSPEGLMQITGRGYVIDDKFRNVPIKYHLTRPHDIPWNMLTETDIGVTGKDFLWDRERLDLNNDDEGRFKQELERAGIYQLADLECRPSYLVFQLAREFLEGYGSPKQLSGIRATKERKLKASSEYPWIAEYFIKRAGIPEECREEVVARAGKVETDVKRGYLGLDVTETGGTMKNNGIVAIGRPVVRTTPRLVVNADFYHKNKGFCDGFTGYLTESRERLKKNNAHPSTRAVYGENTAELFKDRLDWSIFPDENGAGNGGNGNEETYPPLLVRCLGQIPQSVRALLSFL